MRSSLLAILAPTVPTRRKIAGEERMFGDVA